MVTVSPTASWSMYWKSGSRWNAMITFPSPPGAGLPYQCTMERSSSWVQLPFTATAAYPYWGSPVNSTSAEASESLPPPPQVVPVAAAVEVADGAVGDGELDADPATQLFTALSLFWPRVE